MIFHCFLLFLFGELIRINLIVDGCQCPAAPIKNETFIERIQKADWVVLIEIVEKKETPIWILDKEGREETIIWATSDYKMKFVEVFKVPNGLKIEKHDVGTITSEPALSTCSISLAPTTKYLLVGYGSIFSVHIDACSQTWTREWQDVQEEVKSELFRWAKSVG